MNTEPIPATPHCLEIAPNASLVLMDRSRELFSDTFYQVLSILMPDKVHWQIELPNWRDQESRSSFLDFYETLCRQVEQYLSKFIQVVVWYNNDNDSAKSLLLNTDINYSMIVSMLQLVFPEVLFISSDIAELSYSKKIIGNGYSPLMDGQGKRDMIRKVMVKDSDGIAEYLPLRKNLAVAIDDEQSYSLLHAYAAYRAGYKTIAITRIDQANAFLCGINRLRPQLVIEDLYIHYPDGGDGLSDLETRSSYYEGLNEATHRILVTSGFQQKSDEAKVKRNIAFIKQLKIKGNHHKEVLKPHAGTFLLWQASGLSTVLQFGRGRRRRTGVGDDYYWPPESKQDEVKHGHSSPGRLTYIAQHLLNRAERLWRADGMSIQEAVRGAVLATDALELLGGRTPTTSIEALRLKHEFEVNAECRFSGVEHHFLLKPRLQEIRRDVAYICNWFHPKQQRMAALNAEMTILSCLMIVFRQNAQFDEEQECLVRVRHLQNELWRRQSPWRFWTWPVLRYFEFILSSIPNFIISMLVWMFLLSIAYTLVLDNNIMAGIESSLTSFLSPGGPIAFQKAVVESGLHAGIICVAIALGSLHLGVFVAHLYSIIARK